MYPISNHLVYSRLSSQFRTFTIKVDEIQILKDIHSALQNAQWKTVVMDEMHALGKKWHVGDCDIT